MKSLCQVVFLGILFNLIFIKESFGLNCYKCNNCKVIGNNKPEECNSLLNTCYKLEVGNIVMRGCIRKESCTVEDVLNNFTNYITNIIFREDAKNNEQKKVYCCDTDGCNTGVSLSLTLSLLVFGIAVALISA